MEGDGLNVSLQSSRQHANTIYLRVSPYASTRGGFMYVFDGHAYEVDTCKGACLWLLLTSPPKMVLMEIRGGLIL